MVRARLYMKVKPGSEKAFEDAWHGIAEKARSIPGNVRQTLLRDPEDSSAYIITTEWESRDAYARFEVSPEQDELTAPLRALRESAQQVVYDVVADVGAEEEADVARVPKGRVVLILKLKPGMQEQFLNGYESIRYLVAKGVKGHIVDQVCESADDPESWVITSEWQCLDDFLEWERTGQHIEMAEPLRDAIAEAKSERYVVRKETATRGTGG